MPYKTVTSEGFQDLWQSLGRSIPALPQLPSRTTISVNCLNDIYNCFKQKLIEKLAAAPEHATIAVDLWTDSHRRTCYITYTYHYMNDQWQINTAVLETSVFERPHTAKRLEEHFKQTIASYDLSKKKITLVTDGESALQKASRDLKLRRQHCICHSIHLLLCTDLLGHTTTKCISTLLSKLREINYKLIYKHDELKKYDAEDKHQKLLAAIEEFAEIEEILDEEERFYGLAAGDEIVFDLDEDVTFPDIAFNSKFSGLSKMNLTRWNSIPKMTRSHLKNEGK